MARSSATWTYSTCPRGLAPAVSFWAQLNLLSSQAHCPWPTCIDCTAGKDERDQCKWPPLAFGAGKSISVKLAVQEKQHPDTWCLHINNASATIMMNKSHLSQSFKYRGSFSFQLPVLHTERTQGSREVEEFAWDHNASFNGKSEFFLISLDSTHPPTTIYLWICNQFTDEFTTHGQCLWSVVMSCAKDTCC